MRKNCAFLKSSFALTFGFGLLASGQGLAASDCVFGEPGVSVSELDSNDVGTVFEVRVTPVAERGSCKAAVIAAANLQTDPNISIENRGRTGTPESDQVDLRPATFLVTLAHPHTSGTVNFNLRDRVVTGIVRGVSVALSTL